MESVRIEKSKLRDAVQKNRDRHRAEYEKAFEGFAADMRQALEHTLERFRKDAHYNVMVVAQINRPEDHTRDYDVVLEMLKMSADETITLSTAHFRQYVRDEWGWKPEWRVSNAKYLGGVPD